MPQVPIAPYKADIQTHKQINVIQWVLIIPELEILTALYQNKY